MKTDGCRAAQTKGKAQGTSTLQSLPVSPRAAEFFSAPSVARLPNVTKNKDTSFLVGIRRQQKESFYLPLCFLPYDKSFQKMRVGSFDLPTIDGRDSGGVKFPS